MTEAAAAESRLTSAARDGDRHAFEALVSLHKATLYRFLRHYVGDADDAYDLLQETFISAWLALRRYDPERAFASWLRAIALNKCRDFGRRRAVRLRLLALLGAEPRPWYDPVDEIRTDPERIREQRLQRLDQAITTLPRHYKEPLLLTLVSGLTQQQTARELHTSPKAIEMRLRRARERLRAALASEMAADVRPSEG